MCLSSASGVPPFGAATKTVLRTCSGESAEAATSAIARATSPPRLCETMSSVESAVRRDHGQQLGGVLLRGHGQAGVVEREDIATVRVPQACDHVVGQTGEGPVAGGEGAVNEQQRPSVDAVPTVIGEVARPCGTSLAGSECAQAIRARGLLVLGREDPSQHTHTLLQGREDQHRQQFAPDQRHQTSVVGVALDRGRGDLPGDAELQGARCHRGGRLRKMPRGDAGFVHLQQDLWGLGAEVRYLQQHQALVVRPAHIQADRGDLRGGDLYPVNLFQSCRGQGVGKCRRRGRLFICPPTEQFRCALGRAQQAGGHQRHPSSEIDWDAAAVEVRHQGPPPGCRFSCRSGWP